MNAVAVVPALDAARTIADVVQRTRRVLELAIVVDDGSSDGTGEAARRAGACVLSHDRNLGKGRALATGAEHALREGADGVVSLDADGQHLPESIPNLLRAAEGGVDLVLGVRDHLFADMSPVRRCSNRLSSRIISAAAGSRIADVQTGFRWYSRRLLEEVGLREPGFEAESAVLVRAARLGFRVRTTPIELGFVDGRTTSHYRPLRDSARIACAVARARLERVPR